MVDLSLVIACYNDGAHLEASLQEIERTLAAVHYSYELILIDDASPDGSAQTARQSAEQRENVRSVLHETNIGRGGTVAEGFRLSEGTYVGFLDIDLEVHCRYIPSMLQALEDGFDGATAYRHYEIRWNLDTFFRFILSNSYRALVKSMLDLPYQDTETGYKFFRRERILPLLDEAQSNGWFWDTEIMALCHKHGLQLNEIPALFIRRWDKASTVKPVRDSIAYFRELLRFRKRFFQER
ncbi:MAG: glycosyltransferase family 2 protein [Candidatus Hinthialibacter antarcticus]|nr:glycosyltransferase family 2 protein [Candidatus Hinthialibacter antarcticus]